MLSWFLELVKAIADYLLSALHLLWVWLADTFQYLCQVLGLDTLLDYSTGFLSSVKGSPVFTTCKSFASAWFPYIPWDFLSWACFFMIYAYIHIIVFKICKKVFFR